MPTLLTVSGNTNPTLQLTLERDDVAIDLSTASTVELIIKDEATDEEVNTGHQTCVVVTAVSGIVSYAQNAGDFTRNRRYIGDVKITYVSGKVEYLTEQVLITARD